MQTPNDVRMSGAQTNAARAARRPIIMRLIDKVRRRAQHEALTTATNDEDRATIEEINQRPPFPRLQWSEKDKNLTVEHANVSVTMSEYTHHRGQSLVNTIVRQFTIRFTNELRRDDLLPPQRLRLFQKAVIQVLLMFLILK